MSILNSLRAACIVAASAFAGISALAQSPTPAAADGFPTRPIEFLVAYPAGGGTDVNARILARAFTKHTGRAVIVVNKTGASGVIGESYMATQAPADGYTVGIMVANFWLNTFLKSE